MVMWHGQPASRTGIKNRHQEPASKNRHQKTGIKKPASKNPPAEGAEGICEHRVGARG
jgi:hypothetical protein